MSPVRGYLPQTTSGRRPLDPPTREEHVIVTLADPLSVRADGRGSRAILAIGTRAPRRGIGVVLGILLLWLLVGPRIELPGLKGLRVEDLVFAVLAALCLLFLRPFGRPRGLMLAVVGVVATGLVSTVVASARGMVDPVNSALFAVRPLEYWIVFPATMLLLGAARGPVLRRIDLLLAVVTVLQTAFAVMQYYFGLPIGFSHAAYTRAAGLTVGPYELGAISAALVVYWVAHGRFAMASLAVVALATTSSRISILGAGVGVVVFVAIWLVRLLRSVRAAGWRRAVRPYRRPVPVIAGQTLSVIAAALVLGFTVGLIHLPAVDVVQPPVAEQPGGAAEPDGSPTPTASRTPSETPTPSPTASETLPPIADPVVPQAPSDSIAKRLESTSVLGSWDAAALLAKRVPHATTGEEYQDVAYGKLNVYVNVNTAADVGIEASNLVRFFRWHLILDTIDDPVDVIFGLGPSFVGPSVDGSYLRFFADGGILGVLAWLALIVMWLRRSPLWMLCVTLSLLVGASFIDIVYAQRPMVLYWMLLAVALTTAARKKAAAADTADVE